MDARPKKCEQSRCRVCQESDLEGDRLVRLDAWQSTVWPSYLGRPIFCDLMDRRVAWNWSEICRARVSPVRRELETGALLPCLCERTFCWVELPGRGELEL